jgi:hypothetical protein
MKKSFLLKVLAPFFILVFLPLGAAHAISILYEATDLADTTPGDDLWMYSYYVSDFDIDYGFTVFFELGLYDLLDPFPPPPNSDWDPITWDPDLSIPDDGAYDALSLVDNASLADPFTVSFVWLGSGTPGAQPFEVAVIADPDFEAMHAVA